MNNPDRLPPHSMEAEQCAIGSCLMVSDGASELISYGITDQHFYDVRHRSAFKILCEMQAAGKPIDDFTFPELVITTRREQEVGGLDYIASLPDQVPTAANLDFWSDVLKDKFRARRLIAMCANLTEAAYTRTDKVDSLIGQAETELRTLRAVDSKPDSMRDVALEVIDALEQAHSGKILGLKSGLFNLDQVLGGFRKAELITIAGRPGCGKSSLATTLAEKIGIENRFRIGIFSLEMSRKEIGDRIIASLSGVNIQAIYRGAKFCEGDQPALTAAAAKFTKAPLFILDRPMVNISQLMAQARDLKAKHDIDLIIVDYLQIVQATNGRENRSQQVAEIARGLKNLAIDLDVPVIALAQLNRESEKEERRPRLSDLKESGAIEEASNVVGLLHCLSQSKEVDGVLPVKLFIAKNRHGETRDVHLGFRKEVTRFEDFSGMIQ